MTAPVLHDRTTRRVRPVPTPRDPLVGEVLAGRYELLALLGRGGMGRVYEGHDLAGGQAVAVKVLPASVDRELCARFRREARIAAALSHPNIVATRDHGETDGLLWLVMDLCRGRTLSQLLAAEGPLAPRRAVRIAVQALQALAHAHARGIVHRDVKASNIMVEDDRVRVLDFGLAKALDEATRLTRPGFVVGSPRTISPEQCRGEPVDGRADLYGVGVVLYEALTGVAPFDHVDATTLMWQHLTEPARPLREAAPERDLPAALEGIVARALEKDADDRWASADALARALRGVEGALAPRRHAFGARARAPGGGEPLVVVGRSGDAVLARGPGGALRRLERVEREPGLGAAVRAGDRVLVRVGARGVEGRLVSLPAPHEPLALALADGGRAALAREAVSEVELLFGVGALGPGDRFRARSRAGNRFAGRVAWLADGRAGVDLDAGEATTLVLDRLDPTTLELRVPVPLDALWPDAVAGLLPGS